jgi:hypothetical protein
MLTIFVVHNPMPIILVDWSDVLEQRRIITLLASISVQGCSVTLYERSFLFEDYNSLRSFNAFIVELEKKYYLKVVVHS